MKITSYRCSGCNRINKDSHDFTLPWQHEKKEEDLEYYRICITCLRDMASSGCCYLIHKGPRWDGPPDQLDEKELDEFIIIDEVVRLTTLSRVTIWRKTKDGSFPKAKAIGKKRMAWLKSDIKNWIENV